MPDPHVAPVGAAAPSLAELDRRIARLEAPPKKFLGVFKDWQEALKVLGLPAAMIYGGLEFYDKVWTRPDRERAIAATAARDSLRELQAMNAQIYRLNAEDPVEGAQAYIEANRGLKERLVADALGLWQSQPDALLPSEAQIVADELLLDGRTDLAMAIATGLEASAVTGVDKADLALFKGRIAGADGPARDLGAMRAHMKQALAAAAELPRQGQVYAMHLKIASSWLYYELLNETGCAAAAPLADLARELAMPAGEPGRQTLDVMAEERIDLYAARCEPG